MRAKVSRRLVIDACVLRAAGGADATFPLSKHCRDVLTTTLQVCHHAVATAALREEWKRHESSFAKTWKTAMFARKKVVDLEVPPDSALRNEVEAAAVTERAREAMLKDVHLVEAARAADGIIISCDETVRGHFTTVSRRARALKTIVWVNPGQEAEGARAWLEAGAPTEKERQLGAPRKKP